MENTFDVLAIGSGMGALSAACLLARDGLRVAVLEQNWLPGGCTSAYWRKGYVFESGATTLVGLDDQMPLRYLLQQTGIHIDAVELPVPMQVHLADGTTITRHKDLDAWIAEAEKVFGPPQQRPFWEFCYRVSQFVWQTSLRQKAFPPTSLGDLWQCAKHLSPAQLRYGGYALASMRWLLRKYGLLSNRRFVDFVNEQLLITAQNHIDEVNVLFGATALCYTNYGNYYVPGGLINLVQPLVKYIEARGGQVLLRHKVEQVQRTPQGYQVLCSQKGKGQSTFKGRFLVSGIPINNTLSLLGEEGSATGSVGKKIHHKLLASPQLNSAFQMGIAFKSQHAPTCLHHQVHLPWPLPETGSASIFVSLNHPQDSSRSDAPQTTVASVSTHIPDPAQRMTLNKAKVEAAILDVLSRRGFFKPEDVLYTHSSAPSAWQKWTQRAHGFVGGYPQYMRIKPWQMLDARLDGHGAYLCGDTAYPGQGIPGVVLSGIIAYEKLRRDHF